MVSVHFGATSLWSHPWLCVPPLFDLTKRILSLITPNDHFSLKVLTPKECVSHGVELEKLLSIWSIWWSWQSKRIDNERNMIRFYKVLCRLCMEGKKVVWEAEKSSSFQPSRCSLFCIVNASFIVSCAPSFQKSWDDVSFRGGAVTPLVIKILN
jgi:hypothetical protein